MLANIVCFAQENYLYKQVDTTKLYVEILRPTNSDLKKPLPSIIFYFGGGWINGDRSVFLKQAKYFSSRGLICVLVDYRTRSKQGTTPFESLKDAKSAMRYIKKNGTKLGIDTSKIIASGGSAGGHLAAATALVDGFNETTDDLSISTMPCALVLFNPVIDNSPGGYGFDRIGKAYKDFSPIYNIRKGTPPTIFLVGTHDKLIPVETAQYYKKMMERVGSRCDLVLYEGQGHAFFNHEPYYSKTVEEADKFLVSLGYLK